MTIAFPPFLRRYGFLLLLVALLAGAFVTYSYYRQRYIGAVDWYGYFQQGLLWKQGLITLPTELSPKEFPAIVPLGFFPTESGQVVPQYAPGYPFLLGLAGWFGLELWLTPLIGVASCWLIFLLIADLIKDRRIALLYAALWAFFPIVVYGSTNVMSDLVAAFFLLASYLAYRRERVFWSALLLTFALCVRPTNFFYLVIFSALLLRDRRLLRYALYMALCGAPYGLYNYLNYGAPWRVGYNNILGGLSPEVFPRFASFFVWQTFIQFSPFVLLLALWGLWRPTAEKLFYAAWAVVFVLFYSFYSGGGTDRWWWTRYLLPGYIPLFLLSALGFARAQAWLERKLGGARRQAALVALYVLIGATPLYYIWFGAHQNDLWKTNKGWIYYEVVKVTEQTVPPGSYVGSVEFAGSFRIYTPLGSFVSCDESAIRLAEHVFARGRSVYVIVEPWNRTDPNVMKLLDHYATERVHDFRDWGGFSLYRLRPKPARP